MTFFASNVGLTPVAFTPVAFWDVVVVPLVVDGSIVFPIIVLLVGIIPLVGAADDEFVLFCCADTNSVLLILTNTIAIEKAVTAYIISTFVEIIVMTKKILQWF